MKNIEQQKKEPIAAFLFLNEMKMALTPFPSFALVATDWSTHKILTFH